MNKPFFIMAYSQDGQSVIPITKFGELMQFETRQEAEEVAQHQFMCDLFGYEIFEMGANND